MGYIKGVLYFALWYSSILAGYAGLFCPMLPLILISNSMYRTATDYLYTFWQFYTTALTEFLFNCKINVTGDEILANETALIVMNHRTRTDWNFLWPAVYYATVGPGRLKYPAKYILKDEIRHIPGVGWVMQMVCFLYIKRNWAIDKGRIMNMVDYFCDLGYKFCMVIFPEGTDLTPATKQHSDNFAEKNNLPKYDYVLHPRTTGFSYLANRLLEKGGLDAVYDATIIYCDNVPQNEKHILRGQFPTEVKVHFNRHEASTLPRSEEGLKAFLERRWQEKERIIREYNTSRHFLHGKRLTRSSKTELYLALVFWTLLPYVAVYVLMVSPVCRHLVLGHTVFLLLVNWFAGGFPNFEIALHNAKKRLINAIRRRRHES